MHNTPHTAETKAKISAAKIGKSLPALIGNKNPVTHGQSRPRTPAYYSWFNMKDRTTNPNNPRYKHFVKHGRPLKDSSQTWEYDLLIQH